MKPHTTEIFLKKTFGFVVVDMWLITKSEVPYVASLHIHQQFSLVRSSACSGSIISSAKASKFLKCCCKTGFSKLSGLSRNPPKCQRMLPRRQTKHLRSTTNLLQNKTSFFPTQQSIASELLFSFQFTCWITILSCINYIRMLCESCMRQKEIVALYFNNHHYGFHIPREKISH